MLEHDYNGARQRVLQSAEPLLEDLGPAMDTLGLHLHNLQACNSTAAESPSIQVALNALTLYCKIHMHAALATCGEDEKFAMPTSVTGVVQWFLRNFVPLISEAQKPATDKLAENNPVEVEAASPPRRRLRKRASSKHTPTHNGTKSVSVSADDVMSFVWHVTATVMGVACECAGLGASDECLLTLAHHSAISARVVNELPSSRVDVTACCQHVCKLLSAVAIRCDEKTAAKVEEVLRSLVRHKIATGIRPNVQFALVRCMTGAVNGFLVTAFAKSIAQDLLQCSSANEEQTKAQQERQQLMQDSLMIALKRQSDTVKYVVRFVQQQANLSSCLSEVVTPAQKLEGVQAAMSVVLLTNCVLASSSNDSFRNKILPALTRLLQQLGTLQSAEDTDGEDDELSNWIKRLRDELKLILDG